MGPEGNSRANEWRLADDVNEEPMITAVRKHFVAPPSSLPWKSCHTTAGKYSWTDLRMQVRKRTNEYRNSLPQASPSFWFM